MVRYTAIGKMAASHSARRPPHFGTARLGPIRCPLEGGSGLRFYAPDAAATSGAFHWHSLIVSQMSRLKCGLSVIRAVANRRDVAIRWGCHALHRIALAHAGAFRISINCNGERMKHAPAKAVSIPDDIAARYTDPDQFEKFDAAVRTILSVPRSVILEREAEYKRQSLANPNRRGPKRKQSVQR